MSTPMFIKLSEHQFKSFQSRPSIAVDSDLWFDSVYEFSDREFERAPMEQRRSFHLAVFPWGCVVFEFMNAFFAHCEECLRGEFMQDTDNHHVFRN